MTERTDEEELTVEGGERADSDGTADRPEGERADGSAAADRTEGGRADSDTSGDSTVGKREGESGAVGRSEDRTAERFLELESELAEAAGATLPEGTVRRGRLTDAGLVPVAEVPGGYPVEVGDSGQALALTVDLDGGREVPAYLDWPEDGSPGEESGLGRLLAGLDVAPGQLADLYGRRVLVRVTGEHYTLYVPETAPRGSGDDVYGMLAGAVGSLAALAGFALGLPLSLPVFLLVTFVVLPLFTYRDAWYLRTHSDWEGGPLFWTTLAMLPGLNLLSTGLYLRARNRATFLDT